MVLAAWVPKCFPVTDSLTILVSLLWRNTVTIAILIKESISLGTYCFKGLVYCYHGRMEGSMVAGSMAADSHDAGEATKSFIMIHKKGG